MKKKLPTIEETLTKLELAGVELDKLDTKKAKFVELYNRLMGHISNTCEGIGIARQTYYTWLESDPIFAKAIMESEMNLNDEIRDVLINKAGSGDMTAVIFYLKSRHPDFKQQTQVAGEFKDGDKTTRFIITRGE